MKQEFIACFLFAFLYGGDRVEVTADEMQAYESEGKIVFTGNVHTTHGKSWLDSDTLYVILDENNETKRYDAIGHARFEIIDEKKHYKGHAQTIHYYPKEDRYVLKKDAMVDDLRKKRHIAGTYIELKAKEGDALAKSEKKKPVKVIFELEKK